MSTELFMLLIILSIMSATGFRQPHTGFQVRVKLSNYSNPHQVIAETGMPCDQGSSNICDPYFELRMGAQSYSLEWINSSRVFMNAVNLNGVFFDNQNLMEQELPDSLFISVTVIEFDYDADHREYVARPQLEFPRILPSVPHHSNAVRRAIAYTEENRYVSFFIEVEVACLPGVYGRRCNEACYGHVTYPAWNASDPVKSLSPFCSAIQPPPLPTARGKVKEIQSLSEIAQAGLPSYYFIMAGVGVACLMALVAIISGIVSARKRRMEQRRIIYNNQLVYLANPQHPGRGANFRNPIYNPSVDGVQLCTQPQQQLQQQKQVHQYANVQQQKLPVPAQQQQQQQQQPQPQQLRNAANTESVYDEEYEDMDDQKLPPLPPRS